MACSLNEQIKSLVKREFTNYIPVPSVAESTDFNILCFCSDADHPVKRSLTEIIKKTFGCDSGKSAANVFSLGYLFDSCPKKEDDLELNVKEEPVYIHGQAYGSKEWNGGITAISGAGGIAGNKASFDFENNNVVELQLGEIRKLSLIYGAVRYWVSRVTNESAPALFKAAKKGHLFVIYEVLTAEKLKSTYSAVQMMEGGVSATANVGGTTCSSVGGSGSISRRRDKASRLSRPKKMGRYPIAFKCGRVRLKKRKQHLELVGMEEFCSPFHCKDQTDPVNTSDQSQSPIHGQDDESLDVPTTTS